MEVEMTGRILYKNQQRYWIAEVTNRYPKASDSIFQLLPIDHVPALLGENYDTFYVEEITGHDLLKKLFDGECDWRVSGIVNSACFEE